LFLEPACLFQDLITLVIHHQLRLFFSQFAHSASTKAVTQKIARGLSSRPTGTARW
jgi:hypothetical protein